MSVRTVMLKLLLGQQALRLFSFALAAPLMQHMAEELVAPVHAQLEPRQEAPTVAITGIQNAGIQPRLEIRQLEQKADQWNLYMLGLISFMQANESDKLSYYGIAGIHGRPFIAWDGANAPPGGGEPGYCTHTSNLFLPWHRAYMALYEQILYLHMVDVVNSFPNGPDRQRYAQAAMTWRHPYWDWATPPPSGQSTLPSSITNPTVTVTMPNGTAEIANPLYAFQFHPTSRNDFVYQPFAIWNTTMRDPTSWTETAVSVDSNVASAIDNQRPSLMDRLYNLFTSYTNFTEFDTDAWYAESSNVGNADSLEAIHNVIHALTGMNGHMAFVEYSAFDPIFFLHHAMVDRCFALFQILNPNTYVEPMAAQVPTFNILYGDVEDVNSPLEPFHRDTTGDFHTSVTARSWTAFGYNYPELQGNASASSVRAAINRLYGSSAGSAVISKRGLDQVHAEERAAPGESSDGRSREYLANIVSEKLALNGSYQIYVFMGSYNEDPAQWPYEPNLVGIHSSFDSLSPGSGLMRRQDNGGLQISGVVPLTTKLLQKMSEGALSDMTPECVVPYLTENLHWEISMPACSLVPIEHMAGLEVKVVTVDVQPAVSAEEFPQWGTFKTLTEITQGQPGGFT